MSSPPLRFLPSSAFGVFPAFSQPGACRGDHDEDDDDEEDDDCDHDDDDFDNDNDDWEVADVIQGMIRSGAGIIVNIIGIKKNKIKNNNNHHKND